MRFCSTLKVARLELTWESEVSWIALAVSVKVQEKTVKSKSCTISGSEGESECVNVFLLRKHRLPPRESHGSCGTDVETA